MSAGVRSNAVGVWAGKGTRVCVVCASLAAAAIASANTAPGYYAIEYCRLIRLLCYAPSATLPLRLQYAYSTLRT